MTAAFFVAFGVLHYGFFTEKPLRDTPIYERYGDAIVHGSELPYRDFGVEYPPGALPAFAAPSLAAGAGDFEGYSRVFELLMLACGAVASGLTGFLLVRQGAGPPRLVAGTLLAGLAPLALGPVVLSRFDLWPAALTIGALAGIVSGRRPLGFGLLGAAIVAKLYPAVVLPLAIAYVWRREGRRAALVAGGFAVGFVALCFLPFLIASPHGVWSSLSGQAGRPLQLESLGASFLLAAHQAFGLELAQAASSGSDNLIGRLPDVLATVQSLLVVAALIGIWIAFARGPATRDRLLRYSAAAVCAFVALGKVLSPQYLIWLMALVPLVRGRRGIAAAALFVATMTLTQLWFPSRYIELVYGLDPRASWLVVARDLLLVALLVTLVWPRVYAPRLGKGVVAALALAAAAAVGAGFANAGRSGIRTHEGILVATGEPSSCAMHRPAPATTSGAVRYETTSFVNHSARARCVTISLRVRGQAKIFSAAYRKRFDPAGPRRGYLGDAGRCTNLAGATGGTIRYAFVVPAATAFAVDVEPCGVQELPDYRLEVLSPGANLSP